MSDSEEPKKTSLEEKVEYWRSRYESAIFKTMEKTRIKREPPKTEDGVILATFSDRLFASALDTVLILMLFSPALLSLSKLLHGGRTLYDVLQQTPQYQMGDYAGALASSTYIWHFLLENLVNFGIMGLLVVYLWMYSSMTPGKWLLRMRIVDQKTYKKPTNKQFIVRYLSYFVSTVPLGLGFFAVAWDKKKQGWHDKIAGTLVIKVNHWRLKDKEPDASEPPAPPSA